MKHFLSKLALLLFLLALPLCAQIGMNLTADYDNFLRYEPIKLKLLLRNYSGGTLVFSSQENSGRLSFKVTNQAGQHIGSLDPRANPMADLVFGPGESRELEITLNTLFDLQKADQYTVTAFIEHKRMRQAFSSNPVTFEIREGTVLASKTVGLPTANNTDAIQSITASLMRFYDGKREIYCLRIDDDDHVYGTFRIGPFIHGSQPQLDADGSSAIHVLVQVRPRLYSYAVYSMINGEAKQRMQRYYVPNGGVPQIARATGYLRVLYARPAKEGIDFRYQDENWDPKSK